jgi:hypothetical protein
MAVSTMSSKSAPRWKSDVKMGQTCVRQWPILLQKSVAGTCEQ